MWIKRRNSRRPLQIDHWVRTWSRSSESLPSILTPGVIIDDLEEQINRYPEEGRTRKKVECQGTTLFFFSGFLCLLQLPKVFHPKVDTVMQEYNTRNFPPHTIRQKRIILVIESWALRQATASQGQISCIRSLSIRPHKDWKKHSGNRRDTGTLEKKKRKK